jgi:hypothetical protein
MTPTLIINPIDDQIFAAYAHVLVEHGALSVAELERRLRTIYPRATVHPRDLSGESMSIWYVYREGHWTPRGGDPQVEENEVHAGPARRSPSDGRINP